MSQVIRISDALYNRLKSHSEGFDTPANVIEKVLDAYELNAYEPVTKIYEIEEAKSLEIEFRDMDEDEFKTELLRLKYAFIEIFFTDGTKKLKRWNASNFTATSNLNQNLRSGFLRGWRKKGIFKASLHFNSRN